MTTKSIPAFPVPLNPGQSWSEIGPCDGMTIRDYFAAKAMHALVVEPPWGDGGTATVYSWSKGFKGSDSCDRFAFAAYAMADAMLKARTE